MDCNCGSTATTKEHRCGWSTRAAKTPAAASAEHTTAYANVLPRAEMTSSRNSAFTTAPRCLRYVVIFPKPGSSMATW